MIATAIGLTVYFASAPAVLAASGPVEVVRQGIEITVFNEVETPGPALFMPLVPEVMNMPISLAQGSPRQNRMVQQESVQQVNFGGRGPQSPVRSGMALVKDRRLVLNLRAGDNEVRFTDVASTIDPTSVRFISDTDPLGTSVVEQNFEYDLASADALLKRYIDKQVKCVAKDGAELAGYLCSYDDGSIVLAATPAPASGSDRKTQTVSRNTLRAVRLAEVPRDLFVKPTLVWTLRTQRPGRHDTTLSYVCGQAKWDADYVAIVTPGDMETGDRIDLQGWVTVDNRTGATYDNAKIKLIAGDVNRVVDPWAVIPQERNFRGSGVRQELWFGRMDVGDAVKQLEEKAFFEYHLYTLSAPSTVKDQQIKQLRLLGARDVKATRRYVARGIMESGPLDVVASLEFKNEQEQGMGMPLPKGRARLMQRDTDGDFVLIGEKPLDHTPKNEEIEWSIGQAFDVAAERRVTHVQRPGYRRETQTIELRMRNHKDGPIQGRFAELLIGGRNWTISQTSDPWTREAVSTIHFDFVLGANAEKTITYVVDYRW